MSRIPIMQKEKFLKNRTLTLCGIINAKFNYSEVLRIVKRAGWEVIDALIYKSEEELKALYGQQVSSVPFLTIVENAG